MMRTFGYAVVAVLITAGVSQAVPTTPKIPEASPKITKATHGWRIVELHQSACMIKEAEHEPLTYNTQSPADCTRINRASAELRAESMRLLRLPAGNYVFRVFNDAVPYPVGFQLKGAQDQGLPTVKGGDIKRGMSRDFRVKLEPGRYVYGCPLNPTPDYQLIVEE
ncbi:MAG: hypothetical protein ACE366_31315 [Bradymonadia bacterium]